MGATMRWGLAAFAALVVLGLAAAPAAARTITIDDQSCADWGIKPGPWESSDWVPFADVQGTQDNSDDYRPGTAGGRVGPGWGGQTFDAEAIYFTRDADYAYFAVVTGFPATGHDGHKPGDIAIDLGCDGTWDFGIETRGDNDHPLGALYEVTEWERTTSFPQSSPFEIKSGVRKWTPDFPSFTYSSIGNEHYLIETAVPIGAFGMAEPLDGQGPATRDFAAHWTMTCGNDEVNMNATFPSYHETPEIPEPMTCTLLGSGLLAALALRNRKRRKAARAALKR